MDRGDPVPSWTTNIWDCFHESCQQRCSLSNLGLFLDIPWKWYDHNCPYILKLALQLQGFKSSHSWLYGSSLWLYLLAHLRWDISFLPTYVLFWPGKAALGGSETKGWHRWMGKGANPYDAWLPWWSDPRKCCPGKLLYSKIGLGIAGGFWSCGFYSMFVFAEPNFR